MQYYAKSKKKHHFIITPDELRSVLKGFHHVVITTGVQKDYTESDPDVYFSCYDALYQKLKSGQKLIWHVWGVLFKVPFIYQFGKEGLKVVYTNLRHTATTAGTSYTFTPVIG